MSKDTHKIAEEMEYDFGRACRRIKDLEDQVGSLTVLLNLSNWNNHKVITIEEYDELYSRSQMLGLLESAGVDNWEDYPDKEGL